MIIQRSFNPLRDYEDEFIDGPIIDIGCGQSNFLLEYTSTGRVLFAVDKERYQLDALKERAVHQDNNIENWNFINITFPEEPIPSNKYAIIILSNILHFFTLEKCHEIIEMLMSFMEPGTLVYLCVHSDKSYLNDPTFPDSTMFFKHFFSEEDLDSIFKQTEFEKLYFAKVQWVHSKLEKKISSEMISQIDNHIENDLIAVFRKL